MWYVGDYRNFLLPGQKLYELTVDGKKAVAYSRKDMLWRSAEDHKRDLRTFSPHKKDYLCRNSDMLAAFEIEGGYFHMFVCYCSNCVLRSFSCGTALSLQFNSLIEGDCTVHLLIGNISLSNCNSEFLSWMLAFGRTLQPKQESPGSNQHTWKKKVIWSIWRSYAWITD